MISTKYFPRSCFGLMCGFAAPPQVGSLQFFNSSIDQLVVVSLGSYGILEVFERDFTPVIFGYFMSKSNTSLSSTPVNSIESSSRIAAPSPP